MFLAGTKACSTTGLLSSSRSTASPVSAPIRCAHDEKRSRDQGELNLNLPRFRLHPYAAFRAAPSRCLASNSAGLRFPSAEWILTLL